MKFLRNEYFHDRFLSAINYSRFDGIICSSMSIFSVNNRNRDARRIVTKKIAPRFGEADLPFMPSDGRTFPRCSFYRLFFVTRAPISCPRRDFAALLRGVLLLTWKMRGKGERRESRVLTNVRHFLKTTARIMIKKGLQWNKVEQYYSDCQVRARF